MADPSLILPADLNTLLEINKDSNDIADLAVLSTSGVDFDDKSGNNIAVGVNTVREQGKSLGSF